jgi:hypothetical protein
VDRKTSLYTLHLVGIESPDAARDVLDHYGAGAQDRYYSPEDGRWTAHITFRSPSPEAAMAAAEQIVNPLPYAASMTTGLGVHREDICGWEAAS